MYLPTKLLFTMEQCDATASPAVSVMYNSSPPPVFI